MAHAGARVTVGTLTERPDTELGDELLWSREERSAEPEPDWAREIRERRKARGDRLRQIFDGFAPPSGDDEEGSDT